MIKIENGVIFFNDVRSNISSEYTTWGVIRDATWNATWMATSDATWNVTNAATYDFLYNI